MAEFVTIKHPSLPGESTARVTKKAFELIHQPKGWEVVTEGDAPATTTNTASLSLTEQIRRAKEAPAEGSTEETAEAPAASANAPAPTDAPAVPTDAPASVDAQAAPKAAAAKKSGGN